MRTHRLRWQLAAGQAALALALVLGGTIVLASRTDDLRRAEALDGAQRDAAVLARQVGPRLAEGRSVGAILGDSDARRVELVDVHGDHVSGDDLAVEAGVADAIDDRVNDVDGTDEITGIAIAGNAVGIQPVLVDDELEGTVVVIEPTPPRRGWRELYGLDATWAALLCLAAAAMGWLLAGRITRPLSRLTERSRSLVLSGAAPSAPPRQPSRITEVAVLDAAITRVALKIQREAAAREDLQLDLRRLSHELRTPLTTIRLRLEDLSELDEVPEPASPAVPGGPMNSTTSITDDTLSVIAGQVARLDRLAEQLMQLRQVSHRTAEVDLVSAVMEVVARLRPLADWGHVALDLRTHDPIPIFAERDEIEDAVSNVIENAIKHSPRGERVEISFDDDGEHAVLSVADAGPGIAPDLREVITHPGVRVVGSTVVRGTGQGLAIVTTTVDRHGGRVELADSVQGGALVRIVLPRCSAGSPGG
ncbi:MAG: histidine kinase [Ilumatobacteraceae bacterium]|nr:histidine kinase [Ilumatobacteraceae bacterium]